MQEYLDFSIDLARRAALIMLEHFSVGVARDIKDNDTPVTIADTAINSMVIKRINETYPEHAVMGEEESHEVSGADYTWVCDPIDGTIPYTFGMPTNMFSIALVGNDGQPQLAVIYDPYMERMYTAIKGQGAHLNGDPISVNRVGELKSAIIGGSGGQSKVLRAAEFKGAVIAACFRPLIVNCVMYEAMLVATGQIGATVFPGAGAHDAVTSKLIVEEAGGLVTNVYGEEQRYDRPVKGAIISNQELHPQLVELAGQYHQ